MYALSGALSTMAQIPGPVPAAALITRTAAKSNTNGAPIPVRGLSQSRRANVMATSRMANK